MQHKRLIMIMRLLITENKSIIISFVDGTTMDNYKGTLYYGSFDNKNRIFYINNMKYDIDTLNLSTYSNVAIKSKLYV